MMYQVLYYSKGGNTRKLADAIAGELGVKAADVGSSSPDPDAKVIFLGSGVYAGKPGEDLIEFIETHDFRGRKVAIFSTSWRTGESAFSGLADILKRKGATCNGAITAKAGPAFSTSVTRTGKTWKAQGSSQKIWSRLAEENENSEDRQSCLRRNNSRHGSDFYLFGHHLRRPAKQLSHGFRKAGARRSPGRESAGGL